MIELKAGKVIFLFLCLICIQIGVTIFIVNDRINTSQKCQAGHSLERCLKELNHKPKSYQSEGNRADVYDPVFWPSEGKIIVSKNGIIIAVFKPDNSIDSDARERAFPGLISPKNATH